MVYIASDGTVHQGQRPWGVKRIVDTFWTVLDSIGLFVQTLLPIRVNMPRLTSRSRRSSSDRTSFPSGRGSGSPSNRSRRIRTMADILPPPPATPCGGGGCSGGACAR